MELPLYACHKTVRAAMIIDVVFNPATNGRYLSLHTGTPHLRHIVEVSREWAEKHTPKIGGYYVVYDDGYASFSPAGPFESGYSIVADPPSEPSVTEGQAPQ